MRLLLRPFVAIARLVRFLLKRGVQLAVFSIVGALLLFVLDLVLLRNRQPPER